MWYISGISEVFKWNRNAAAPPFSDCNDSGDTARGVSGLLNVHPENPQPRF